MPHRNDKAMNKLNKSLDLLSRAGVKDTILANDFNSPDVDWDSYTVHSRAQDNTLQRSSHPPPSPKSTISHATRQSALLDLTFTSNPSIDKNSTSIPGLSDHDMVVTDFKTKPQKSKENPVTYYIYTKAKWENIGNDLDLLLVNIKGDYKNNANVETLWSNFKKLSK